MHAHLPMKKPLVAVNLSISEGAATGYATDLQQRSFGMLMLRGFLGLP